MMSRDTSVPADYFENLYEQDPDPWRFASSPYERDKYAATLAAIGDEPIARGWEAGCSIGVFTRQLASRCGMLLAVDVADAALEQARRRCADLPRVIFERKRIPHEWPDGQFDLIIFSEVLYFLSASDVRLTARKSIDALAPAGRIILVNWTGETGHSLSGDMAADLFRLESVSGLEALRHERHPGYQLDVYRRGPR
jgi:trans-aconitate methyltransferase